jgi:hypothetical protein
MNVQVLEKKEQTKPQISKHKELRKITPDINEMEKLKYQKINETKT